MTNVRAHVFVTGLVQGVFFRQKTKQQAENHGVRGWVHNLEDGRVEAVFEGEEVDVNALVDFCRNGPRGAQVTNVEVEFEMFLGEFQNFKVTY
ncbi:MAG: acylphosphatase [Candidatus Bathyarchaeia archaeon]|jgi:acylphosphatase